MFSQLFRYDKIRLASLINICHMSGAPYMKKGRINYFAGTVEKRLNKADGSCGQSLKEIKTLSHVFRLNSII